MDVMAGLGARRFAVVIVVSMSWLGTGAAAPPTQALDGPSIEPLGKIELPAEWRARFWKSSEARALLKLSPARVAELVPAQSGIRYCGCPACGAEEGDDPLAWSIERPKVLKCRRCGEAVPSDKYPAKVNKEVPEEKVEVLPGVIHHYPYHAVDEAKAHYPDERLYLQAKIDDEARRFLAKAALYAAAESRAQAPQARDPRLAQLACMIMVKLAQVYPAYATHCDQPGRPKSIEPARLRPPFRRGYQTGKWEWNGSLEVPLNLVLAYALLRGDPAWEQAGKLLGEPAPAAKVERDLFRAAAGFARNQPDEIAAEALHVDRGMLAVGRLLGDEALVAEALTRLDTFTRRGFYHDGFWHEADVREHRRVVGLLDGWVSDLLAEERARRTMPDHGVGVTSRQGSRRSEARPLPVLDLAHRAAASIGSRPDEPGVLQASWPGRPQAALRRRPMLLGGAGVARLAIGQDQQALDVEVRAQDSFGRPHFQRLAIRLSVAGIPILDDLDEHDAPVTGWQLATTSHNTVVVDGLNQRETPTLARTPAPGGNVLFFAADRDFQVISIDDPRAYPQSTARYRHTVVASSSEHTAYALSIFEVHGGLQHDQVWHAAPGRSERWRLAVPTRRTSESLLPGSITFLPAARPDQGRWFVQSYGEFETQARGALQAPSLAGLVGDDATANAGHADAASPSAAAGTDVSPTLLLHLMGDMPMTAITALSPELPRGAKEGKKADSGTRRASLILRRQSQQGESLISRFVTLLEPTGPGFHRLRRVGRVSSSPETIVIQVESSDSLEYLLVNLKPGTTQRVQLPSGKYTSFDGVALRVREQGLVLAGGTFAEGSGRLVTQPQVTGTISGVARQTSERGAGWFLTPERLPDDPAVAGRTLILQHGDGTSRCWTLDSIESTAGGTRLHVREEPGFMFDALDRTARYYQFPQVTAPGPHRFHVAQVSR
jgi:hypothetical protein